MPRPGTTAAARKPQHAPNFIPGIAPRGGASLSRLVTQRSGYLGLCVRQVGLVELCAVAVPESPLRDVGLGPASAQTPADRGVMEDLFEAPIAGTTWPWPAGPACARAASGTIELASQANATRHGASTLVWGAR